MRNIILFAILTAFLHIHAADTLTRAEVYNFHIGDTLDYKLYHYYEDTYNAPIITETVNYQRIIISGIYWSADTQTKYIVRGHVYPLPAYTDTYSLPNINSYEVYLDTPGNFNTAGGYGRDTIIANTSSFWGRPTNFLRYSDYSPTHPFTLFARGLGPVVDGDWGGAHCCLRWLDTTSLIYFSGDSGTYGTPYTTMPNAVNELSAPVHAIRIYPNPADRDFTIETSDALTDRTYSISDLSGRTLVNAAIESQHQFVSFGDQFAPGIYLLHVSGRCFKLMKE